MKGTVNESIQHPGVAAGRKIVFFLHGLTLSVFPQKKKFLQNFNESNSFPEDKIAVIHTFLSFFVFLFLPPSHTDVHAHT